MSGGDGSSGSNMAIKRRRPFQVGWGGCGFRAPFMFDSRNGMVRGFSFQKVPKCDWHGPRSHINHVLPIKTADQIPAEVVQMGIEDDGNPRPLFVVAKNLTVANYGDILAGLRIDNIAVEHGFLVCVCDVTFTTPNPPRCSGRRAIFRGCREMARSLCQMCALRRSIVCEPCKRRGRYSVAKLMVQHADATLPDLLVTLADSPKARSANIYDRCRAVYEKAPL